LEDAPRMGCPLPELGPEVRMLLVEEFRVVYRVDGSEILILHVIHTRRDLPKAWRA
jgi:plasmid stabilization system protein ParE